VVIFLLILESISGMKVINLFHLLSLLLEKDMRSEFLSSNREEVVDKKI
jgi:hypothetical protein